MTNDEVRKFLDEISPAYYSSTSLANNSSLSDDEINLLCQIASDLKEIEDAMEREKEEKEDKKNKNKVIIYDIHYENYLQSLDAIAPIIRRYNSGSMKTKSKNPSQASIPKNAKGGSCPHLIKQVLFYLACIGQMEKTRIGMLQVEILNILREKPQGSASHKIVLNFLGEKARSNMSKKEVLAILKEKAQSSMSQKDIVDYLKGKGVAISYNFFSRMDCNPTDFLSLRQYKQPKMPCNYNGQKHDELGHAIAYLVYQAGKHEYFIDLFGGTGAATLSFKHRRNSKYVYNELNDQVFNLFRVLSDKQLSKQLRESILALQQALRNEKTWLDENFLQNELMSYYNRHIGKVKKDDVYDLLTHTVNIHSKRFIISPESLERYKEYESALKSGKAGYIDMSAAYRDINGTYEGETEELSLAEYYENRMRYIAYAYYAYFDNLYYNNVPIQGNEVDFALAEIFRRKIAVNNSIGPSTINRMITDKTAYEQEHEGAQIFTFMNDEDDYQSIIKNITDLLIAPKVILENDTFSKIIPKYKSAKKPSSVRQSNVIFYADPPYAGTTDYKSDEGGVSSFTAQDMHNLIDALVNCGDKFIYSCRTTGSAKSVKEREKTTKAIFETVFLEFINHWVALGGNKVDNPFWVLAIEQAPEEENAGLTKAINDANAILEKNGLPTKGDEIDLASLTYADQAPEIMITNFEIKDIPITQKQKNFRYKVYTFDEFVKILLVKGEMLGLGKVDRDLLN